jgi:hypothetical protein
MNGPGPLIVKSLELREKRIALLEKLLPLARAAANQMKDAHLDRGADPILSLLFEIDALEEISSKLVTDNKDEFVAELIEGFRRSQP